MQTDDKSRFNATLDKTSMKLAIKFLLDNCFFKFDNFSFQQIILISLGFDLAPFFANLFLYYKENRWHLDTKKINKKHALSEIYFFL